MEPVSDPPDTNKLQLRITIHRLNRGREVAVSYTDGNGILHRTPFLKDRGAAEAKLKEWARGVTGLAEIKFVAAAETVESNDAMSCDMSSDISFDISSDISKT
ncbi:MAG: hypothetical protein V7609_2108 [Verrucomicrobiota bacterium]